MHTPWKLWTANLKTAAQTGETLPTPEGSEFRVLIGALKSLGFESHELLNHSGEAFFQESSYAEGTYYIDKRKSMSKWRRRTGEGAFNEKIYFEHHTKTTEESTREP